MNRNGYRPYGGHFDNNNRSSNYEQNVQSQLYSMPDVYVPPPMMQYVPYNQNNNVEFTGTHNHRWTFPNSSNENVHQNNYRKSNNRVPENYNHNRSRYGKNNGFNGNFRRNKRRGGANNVGGENSHNYTREKWNDEEKYNTAIPLDKDARELPNERTVSRPSHNVSNESEDQRNSLIEQLSNNKYECMVCFSIIRFDAAVWGCTKCYHLFHLYCIKKWFRSSEPVDKENSTGWRCPACQNITYTFPHKYLCFCEKVRDPQSNRYEVPHSCGELCGKKRHKECNHPCNILCHPGPCPPCQTFINKVCDCKKTSSKVKCGDSAVFKCDTPCGNPLNCVKHYCELKCHSGPCNSCAVTEEQTCFCSNNTRTVICGSSDFYQNEFSCQNSCNKPLDCGFHFCLEPCHKDKCASCVLSPENQTNCPCGKTELSLLSEIDRSVCTDVIPVCQNICGKLLSCGLEDSPHECYLMCHEGPCLCNDVSMISCFCGTASAEIKCVELKSDHEEFKCMKKCNKKKSCGRHKCNDLCCIQKEHICEQICGKKLTCEQHRCEEFCHRGNCPRCYHVSFDDLHCYCGAEVIYPPVDCGASPPDCKRICSRLHSCNHPVRHYCHCDEQCPPCTELTQKYCMGDHEIRRNIPCHLQDISCGFPCKKKLTCGHNCLLTCHKGPCDGDTCKQSCMQVREECSHICNSPCHFDQNCPKSVCHADIIIKCKCGNRKEKKVCLSGGAASDKENQQMATMIIAMKMAEIRDGQSIDISCFNNKTEKMKLRELDCNSECNIKERNKKLSLALGIDDKPVKDKPSTFPDSLKSYAKNNLTLVSSIEQSLSELVNSAQAGKQPRRRHAFPVMNNQKRRIVKEIAVHYCCETEEYDDEPNRNVVATAIKGFCRLPNETLTSLVQRELYPKAPLPVPFGCNENDMRKSINAMKQSTSVIAPGAWSNLSSKSVQNSEFSYSSCARKNNYEVLKPKSSSKK